MPAEWRVHCFDAFTGEKIWEKDMPNSVQQIDFADSRLLAVKDEVMANAPGKKLYSFNASTGNLLWSVNPYTATANRDLLEYNGVIYLSSSGNGLLVGID